MKYCALDDEGDDSGDGGIFGDDVTPVGLSLIVLAVVLAVGAVVFVLVRRRK